MKILIVEDDQNNRENLEDILELHGHAVQGVPSGADALDLCRKREFDSIILDWKLPDRKADELIPDLQNLQPDKPIIVVTGYGDVELIVLAMRNGVYDYLEKPINPSVLQATLARVAERQEYQDQLQKVQEQLVASERLAAIGQMVAGLAHESRNAFQRSQAGLEMLELNLAEDEENLAIISKVQKALEELQRLYEEVREYSAPVVLANDQVNILSLIHETWRQIQSINRGSDLELEVVATEEVKNRTYTLDLHRFHQVLRNLMENAVDATDAARKDDAAVPAKVSVALREESDRLFIEITDEGSGIPAEERDNIFEPFFTTKTKGTGLGLAITKRVIEKHGGAIAVVDSPEGARFQIQLPIRKSEK